MRSAIPLHLLPLRSGSDYNALSSGTITIPAMVSSASLSIPIINDEVIEDSEYFVVSINHNGPNAEPYSTSFSVIISDDDTGPYFIDENISFDIDENTIEVGRVSATDADNDSLTYSISGTDAAVLSIDASTGDIIFTTAPDFETKASFEAIVTASDGVNEATQELAISVKDINDAPTITSTTTAFNAAENQTTIDEGTITASDQDANDTFTFAVSGDVLTIDAETGVLSFVSAPDFETTTEAITATVTVTDAAGLTDTQEVTVTVTDENEAPEFTSSSSFNADENQSSVGTLTATDIDADNLTFSIDSGADGDEFELEAESGVLTFKTTPDFETKSSYELKVTVSDGELSASQDIVVNINDVSMDLYVKTLADAGILIYTVEDIDTIQSVKALISSSKGYDIETIVLIFAGKVLEDNRSLIDYNIQNEATIHLNLIPVITSDAVFSANENQAEIGSVTANDPDSDTLTYSVSGSELAISSQGVLSFVSNPNYEDKSVYTATVTVTDPDGLSDTQDVTVNVADVNDAPTITSTTTAFNAAENQTTIDEGTITASDQDANDTFTFSVSGDVLTIDAETGVLSFVSAPDFETTTEAITATVTVTDAAGLTDTQEVTVTVTDENEAPTISSTVTVFSAAENQTAIPKPGGSSLNASINAVDVDANDTLTFSVSGNDLAIDANGVLSFATAPDFEATTSVTATVTVTDAGGLTDTKEVSVTVTDVDEAPVFVSPTQFNVDENILEVGTIEATIDTAGDRIEQFDIAFNRDSEFFEIVYSVNNLNKAILKFKDAADFEQKDTYQVQVVARDKHGFGNNQEFTTSQIVTVTLNDLNDEAPVFTSDSTFTIDENTTAVTTLSNY